MPVLRQTRREQVAYSPLHLHPLERPARSFMPRDSDKNNDSRGRRDRAGCGHGSAGGKGRSGVARGPEKKFAKRGFGDKGDRDNRSSGRAREGRPFRRREDGDAPRRDFAERPRFRRDDRGRDEGEKRSFRPRGERRGDQGYARPAGKFSDRKFGDKRPHDDRDREKRPYTPRADRAERKFEDRKFSRGDRDKRSFGDKSEGRSFRRREEGDAPRRDFGDRPRFKRDDRGRDREFEGRDRGELKPWQKRDGKPRDDRGGSERPRFSRGREDRTEGDRPFRERPKFSRPRWDRDGESGDRDNRRRERPEGRKDWHEHPRSEGRFSDRPRRDNEDDSKIF